MWKIKTSRPRSGSFDFMVKTEIHDWLNALDNGVVNYIIQKTIHKFLQQFYKIKRLAVSKHAKSL